MAEKNVIIVGGSFAGHSLANYLGPKLQASHRIILVEQNEFTVHLPGVVRGLVEPGSEEKNLTAPTRQETVFKAGSRHHVLCPVRVRTLLKGSLILDAEFEGSTEVHFDKCIIATGATQHSPLRPETSTSRADYKGALRHVQNGIAKASSVLIVGGGAVGVEVAGEVTSHYPGTSVTMVHGRSRLLETADQVPANTLLAPQSEKGAGQGKHAAYAYPVIPERVAHSLSVQLRARGVDIILNNRVCFPTPLSGASSDRTVVEDVPKVEMAENATPEAEAWDGCDGLLSGLRTITLTSGQKVLADYVFAGTGNAPNSSLVSSADPSAINEAGYVAVDDQLRILAGPSMGSGYYALGDVANTGGRKTAGQANLEARRLASILLAHIKCESKGHEPRAKPYAVSSMRATLIPLGNGPGGVGAGVLELGWLGTWRAPDWMLRWFAKEYFVSLHFVARYKGEMGVKNL